MSDLELLLIVSSVILYAASFFACLITSRNGLAVSFLLAGLLMQLGSAAVRWADIGHPPINGTYEACLAASWFLLIYTASSYRSIHSHSRTLALTTVPIAVLIIVYGFAFNTSRIPLTISERSLWVDFHALFSWLAFGSYAVSFCLAGVYLVTRKRGTSPPVQEGVLDDLIFLYINFGFINHTVMFALGSYYSSILFGVWWQWDLVNSTSLITWLVYALAIHMRLFYGWKGDRGAILSIIAFLTAIVSYWGLIYFPPGSTYHVFDLEFKRH